MIRIPEKYFWPGMVIAILSLSVVANIILVYASQSDGGPQVIDNYYEKSLEWDKAQAELKRVREMGWDMEILVGPQQENREVRFVLTDRSGTPIAGLLPHVVLRSPAKVPLVSETDLRQEAPGVYVGEFPIHHNGFWDFDFKARLGDGDFVTSKRVEVLP